MRHFEPTLNIKDTYVNIRKFVKGNNREIWKIFVPLVPYVVVLSLFDAIISDIFFPHSERGFFLGALIASYFYSCLSISWYRVAVNGADNYESMNPFKPKRHELAFFGVGAIISVLFIMVSVLSSELSNFASSGSVVLFSLAALIAVLYIILRVSLYFPAKALDEPITIRAAFKMSDGYVWKLLSSYIMASMRIIGALFIYYILAGLISYILKIAGVDIGLYLKMFVINLPLNLYFQPVINVIAATAGANYYLYVIQNAKAE